MQASFPHPPSASEPKPFPPVAAGQVGVPAKTRLLPSLGRNLFFAALFALFVFVTSLLLDYTLLVHKDSALATVEISDIFAGLLAGVLFFKILQAWRAQRQQILNRLDTIDEMNHHIRNALQVISLTVHANPQHAQELANIDQSVNRIQWTLREILPKF